MRRYRLMTLGEAMLRLTPPSGRRLEQAEQLELNVAGSELSVAALLARLGWSTAWVSRLPDGPLGRLIADRARVHGVSTDHISWIPEARTGLMFYEPGPPPRSTRVIYDRKDSAAAGLSFQDADWPALLDESERLHLTGITPALGPQPHELVARLAALAKERGCAVSYDLNFRSTLTTPENAREVLLEVMPQLELLILNRRDALTVLEMDGPLETLAGRIAEQYGLRAVALSHPEGGAHSCSLYSAGETHFGRAYEVEVLDRLGAGDALAAGLLYGLASGDPARAAQLAGYLAALALATPGDINWVGPEDLIDFEMGRWGSLKR